MSMYIEPPSGNISLVNLKKFAKTRLDFLLQVFKICENQDNLQDVLVNSLHVTGSDCLIEGTSKDHISHFILRLAMCTEMDTKEFFISAETKLFKYRLQCMTQKELQRFLKKLDIKFTKIKATLKKDLDSIIRDVIENFFSISDSRKIPWRIVASKFLQSAKDEFFVPYYVVPDLVASRSVMLNKGLAAVPYGYLDKVMVYMFRTLLSWGVAKATAIQEKCLSDQRIRCLVKIIQKSFREKFHPGNIRSEYITSLSHTQIDEAVNSYPPCMRNLHFNLRTKNRLRHQSRIQYTLFLKEIGMPVHEALLFWKNAYSVPSTKENGCGHNWQESERRYTYNIRHLYGLEGSHTNYRGHCCASIQNMSITPGEDGGCPFKHFDQDHLKALLQNDGLTYPGEIIQTAKSGNFSAACSMMQRQKAEMIRSQTQMLVTAESETGVESEEEKNRQSPLHVPDHYQNHDNNQNNIVKTRPKTGVNCKTCDMEGEAERNVSTTIIQGEKTQSYERREITQAPEKREIICVETKSRKRKLNTNIGEPSFAICDESISYLSLTVDDGKPQRQNQNLLTEANFPNESSSLLRYIQNRAHNVCCFDKVSRAHVINQGQMSNADCSYKVKTVKCSVEDNLTAKMICQRSNQTDRYVTGYHGRTTTHGFSSCHDNTSRQRYPYDDQIQTCREDNSDSSCINSNKFDNSKFEEENHNRTLKCPSEKKVHKNEQQKCPSKKCDRRKETLKRLSEKCVNRHLISRPECIADKTSDKSETECFEDLISKENMCTDSLSTVDFHEQFKDLTTSDTDSEEDNHIQAPKSTVDLGTSGGASCFDHEVCLSQIRHKDINTNCTSSSEPVKHTSEHQHITDIVIRKPSEFYFSLKNLLDGLKEAG